MSKVTTLVEVKQKLKDLKAQYDSAKTNSKEITYKTHNFVPKFETDGALSNPVLPDDQYFAKSNDSLETLFKTINDFEFSQDTFHQATVEDIKAKLDDLKSQVQTFGRPVYKISKPSGSKDDQIDADVTDYQKYVVEKLLLCISNLENPDWENDFPVTIDKWLTTPTLHPERVSKQQIVSFLQSVIRCPYYSN